MKSPEMEKFLDKMSYMINHGTRRTRSYCIKHRICVDCGSPAISFRNAISEREFQLSALCQKCQDSVFGED